MVTKPASDTMKSTVPPGTPLIINSMKEAPSAGVNGSTTVTSPPSIAIPGGRDAGGGQKPPASLRRLDYIRQQFLFARKAGDGEKSFVIEGKQCRSKSQPMRISNGHSDGVLDRERADTQMRKAMRRDEEGGIQRISVRNRDIRSSYQAPVALPVLSVGNGGPGFSHRLKSRSLPGDRSSDTDPHDHSHMQPESDYLSESETAFDTGSITASAITISAGGKMNASPSINGSVSPRKVSKKVNNFFPKPSPVLVSQEDFLDICVDTQKSASSKMSASMDGKSPSGGMSAGDQEMSRSKTITLSLNSENAARSGGAVSRRSHSFRSRMEGSPFGRSSLGAPKAYHDTAAAQASHANFHKRLMSNKYVEAIEIKVAVEDGGNDPLRASTEAKPVSKKVVAKYSDIAIQRDLDDFFRVKPAFT